MSLIFFQILEGRLANPHSQSSPIPLKEGWIDCADQLVDSELANLIFFSMPLLFIFFHT
jgi:hypothetical protein